MNIVLLLGRALFSLIFIVSLPGHFSKTSIDYASAAGVPMASILVPLSGIMAAVGGLSILLGYRAKIGAWILVAFMLPVTFTMHNFWAVSDSMMAQMHMAMFMKNIALVGAAFLLAYFGAGPLSLDARRAESFAPVQLGDRAIA